MSGVPVLETERLLVRPLTMDDLDAIYQVLDVEIWNPPAHEGDAARLREERRRWLLWTTLSYEQLANLHQPPYGERAVVLKETGELIGAVGYAPCLDVFGQIPSLRPPEGESRLFWPEVGLFWAISPRHQGHGYATEAARAMVDYAFNELKLRRIVATTEYDNLASQGVMRKLGMRLDRLDHLGAFPSQLLCGGWTGARCGKGCGEDLVKGAHPASSRLRAIRRNGR